MDTTSVDQVKKEVMEVGKRTKHKLEEVGATIAEKAEKELPPPLSRLTKWVRGMGYRQLIFLAAGLLFCLVLSTPLLLLFGGFLILVTPVILLTSPIWVPIVVTVAVFTRDYWFPAVKSGAIRASIALGGALNRVQDALPLPLKSLFSGYRKLSYKAEAAIAVVVGAVVMSIMGFLLVVGPPTLFFGGGLLLAFSPLLVATVPLWLPVFLLAIDLAKAAIRGIGLLFTLATVVYQVYKYFVGPASEEGDMVSSVEGLVQIQETLKQTKQYLAESGQKQPE
ncbi:hypothetical protein CBR_g53675 [Chara braunii]|uniref:Oleosin n=1 Tax=Chara braunii TaxID=69332 RepID=A0A388MB46_CHABU|nr:hypothetical protein CBR_g53675 [Chara braunii]|eukprot:GBG91786.1 hypothetical protein CBR_g53675 [Chara braunii]